MKMEAVIDWLANLTLRSLPPDRQTEQVLSADDVLRATVILNTEECSLLKMHDFEGHTMKNLERMTGLPCGMLEQKIAAMRGRLLRLIRKQGADARSAAAEE